MDNSNEPIIPPDDVLIDGPQVDTWLGIRPTKRYTLIAAGHLKPIKIGHSTRFRRGDVRVLATQGTARGSQ